jgi:hypothetical protein
MIVVVMGRTGSGHNTKENEMARERKVMVSNGVREVVVGDAECWSVYTVIPRTTILDEVRRLRSRGWRWSHFERSDIIPDGLEVCESYGGPGRSFSRAGYLMAKTRRFYTFVQSGGMDI